MMNIRINLEVSLREGFLMRRMSRRRLLKLSGLCRSALLICVIASLSDFLVHNMSYFGSHYQTEVTYVKLQYIDFLQCNSSFLFMPLLVTGQAVVVSLTRYSLINHVHNKYVSSLSIHVSCKHSHMDVYFKGLVC